MSSGNQANSKKLIPARVVDQSIDFSPSAYKKRVLPDAAFSFRSADFEGHDLSRDRSHDLSRDKFLETGTADSDRVQARPLPPPPGCPGVPHVPRVPPPRAVTLGTGPGHAQTSCERRGTSSHQSDHGTARVFRSGAEDARERGQISRGQDQTR